MDGIKCLYYIKDNRTDKVIYIGQTKNFENRKKSHFGQKYKSIDLHMFNEGRENFSMNIFENIDCLDMSEEEILKKEDELILYYDTINSGFNKQRSGGKWYGENRKDTAKNYYNNSYSKKYYDETREYQIERRKLYYKENHEKQLAYRREYYRKKRKEQSLINSKTDN